MRADPDPDACTRVVEDAAGPLVTTALVVAEAGYLIARQRGPLAEVRFFRSLAGGDLGIEVLSSDDLARVADLVERYADLPLGGTDASLSGRAGWAERLVRAEPDAATTDGLTYPPTADGPVLVGARGAWIGCDRSLIGR